MPICQGIGKKKDKTTDIAPFAVLFLYISPIENGYFPLLCEILHSIGKN